MDSLIAEHKPALPQDITLMDPTRAQLQKVLESLTPGEWLNPHIFTYEEETRFVHVLMATKPGTTDLYCYEPDTGEFEPLILP